MHWFKFEINDDILRKKAYKECMRWLRICRNKVEKKFDFEKIGEDVHNLLVYGTTFNQGI